MTSSSSSSSRVGAVAAVFAAAALAGCSTSGPSATATAGHGAGTPAFARLPGPADSVEVLGGALVPGQPLVARQVHDGVRFTLSLTPARPGWNLVRVGTSERTHRHAAEVSVGTGDHAVPARPRPGVDGLWARVRLPAGVSQVFVSHGPEHRLPFTVDTGLTAGAATARSTAADGPECAVAGVATALAGGTVDESCPADSLGAADADALRRVVTLLGERGARTLTLATDTTPRGRAAARTIRAAAAEAGVKVLAAGRIDPASPPAGSALLVTSGWAPAWRDLSTTARAQRRGAVHEHGVWLAPWLLTPRLVDAVPGAVLPLRFDVRGAEALRYASAVRRRLPDSSPTGSGFIAWAAARDVTGPEPASLYAASRAAYLPASSGHDHHPSDSAWFPGGTVTRVSGPLT